MGTKEIRWLNPEGRRIPLVVTDVPQSWVEIFIKTVDVLWGASGALTKVMIATLRSEKGNQPPDPEGKVRLSPNEIQALQDAWKEVRSGVSHILERKDGLRRVLELLAVDPRYGHPLDLTEAPQWWVNRFFDLVVHLTDAEMFFSKTLDWVLGEGGEEEIVLNREQVRRLWDASHILGERLGEIYIKRADLRSFLEQQRREKEAQAVA